MSNIYFQDIFPGSGDLKSHAPSIPVSGGAWTNAPGATGVLTISPTGFVRPNAVTVTNHLVCNATASSTGEVRTNLRIRTVTTTPGQQGLTFKVHATTNNIYYFVNFIPSNPGGGNGAGTIQLYFRNTGSLTPLGSAYTVPTYVLDTTHELAARYYTNGDVKIYWDGVEVISMNDTTITAAGKVGILSTLQSAVGDAVGVAFDDYVYQDDTTPPTISLTSTSKVVQRKRSYGIGRGSGMVAVAGILTATTGLSTVIGRVGTMAWKPIATNVAAGVAFSGSFRVKARQGTLEVRIQGQDDVPTARATVANVTVGDVYICGGQSNFKGRLFDNQLAGTWNHHSTVVAMMRALNGNVVPLADPSGNASGTLYGVFADTAQGSIPAIIGYKATDKTSVPVCIINCAVGGTDSTFHLPAVSNPYTTTTTCFGATCQMYLTGGFGIEDPAGILWDQGESDTSAATWIANTTTIANAFKALWPSVTMRVGKLQYTPGTQSSVVTDGIRAGFETMVTAGTILRGPDLNTVAQDASPHWTLSSLGGQVADLWVDGYLKAEIEAVPLEDDMSWDDPVPTTPVAGSYGELVKNMNTKLGTPAGASLAADIAALAASVVALPATTWAYLTTSASTVGSMGKYLVDSFTTLLTSRLTSQRAANLDNLATASPTAAQIRTEMEQTGSRLQLIDARLPATPATEASVQSRAAPGDAMALAANAVNAAAVATDALAEIADAVTDHEVMQRMAAVSSAFGATSEPTVGNVTVQSLNAPGGGTLERTIDNNDPASITVEWTP